MKIKKAIAGIALSTMLIASFPHATEAAGTASATIVQSVNMRSGPSTSAGRIRYLKSGESVTILSKVNAYWYKIADSSNRTGYVSTLSRYIKVNTGSAAANNAAASGNTSATATVVRSVSFRSGPSTSAGRIRYLQKGEQLSILAQVNSYWLHVSDKNGKVGYVSSSSRYIQTGTAAPSSPPAASASGSTAPSQMAAKVIEAGKKYLGTPYQYGSSRSNTSTFDCSDFVRQSFLDGIGLKLPADSRQQGDYVKQRGHVVTDWHQLKPGDIMFFMSYQGYRAADYTGVDKSSQRITHDGIYLGNGQVLHTYSVKSGGVRIDNIAGKAWEYRFLYGGSAF